jgi:predicted anti-sigma-YlaC factor YlaD
MNAETVKIETVCSQSDLAAYLDGELDAAAEARIETHLSACEDCFNALKEQKMVLCALNAALDNRIQIELPVNFAKKVAVRAESGLNGLRKREERWMAVTLCVLLFGLIGAVGLAGEASGVIEFFAGGVKVVSSVGGLVWGVFYNAGLGAVVIIRTLTRYLLSDSNVSLLGILLVLILSFILCSSFYLRFRRFKF